MSEANILRAAEEFYRLHNAMMAGMATVNDVSRAEKELHIAIWTHYALPGEQMEQIEARLP